MIGSVISEFATPVVLEYHSDRVPNARRTGVVDVAPRRVDATSSVQPVPASVRMTLEPGVRIDGYRYFYVNSTDAAGLDYIEHAGTRYRVSEVTAWSDWFGCLGEAQA